MPGQKRSLPRHFLYQLPAGNTLQDVVWKYQKGGAV